MVGGDLSTTRMRAHGDGERSGEGDDERTAWIRAAGGDGARQERRVEAAGGYGERRRCGGSRAKNEDDGWGDEDEAIYIWRIFSPR